MLCTLRSGLTAVGAPPFVQAIVTGGVLMTVAILDGPELAKHLFVFGRRWRSRSPIPEETPGSRENPSDRDPS